MSVPDLRSLLRPGAVLAGLLAAVCLSHAAELRVDLLSVSPGGLPPGFRPALTGGGPPADWQVVLTDAPVRLAPINPEARPARLPAIAQLSRDPTDERFPLLVYEEQIFTDFTLRVRLRMLEGEVARMAGIAFRLLDENNYYVARLSASGNTLRFYRVYRGERSVPVGPDLEIPSGVWHDLEIECVGNRIRIRLNDREAMPELTDPTFREGRIALWTKSDSVSQFTDLHLTYTPRTTLAEELVQNALKRYDQILEIEIFSTTSDRQDLHVVASHDPATLGRAATETEQRVLRENIPLAGRRGREFVVAMPLRDRNGDPIAAVRVVTRRFSGQTAENAVARATPILRQMQARVLSREGLTR